MGYATLADLASSGLPPSALASISDADKQAALDDRSDYADTYIGDKAQLPLQTPYPRTLVRMVCFQAAWDLLCLRGFNPDNPADLNVQRRYEEAEKWYARVANGQARVNFKETQPPSLQPDVSTNCLRGYGDMGEGGTDDPLVGGSDGWGV